MSQSVAWLMLVVAGALDVGWAISMSATKLGGIALVLIGVVALKLA